MKIAVLMKLVAGSNTESFRCGGTVRSLESGIVNPADVLALETAVRINREIGAEIAVFTMGPNCALSLLKDASRLGTSRNYLVSDPCFAGSDTYATAKILSRALVFAGGFDLILCGERAIDGETGQVPGELSAMVGASFASGVIELETIEERFVVCRCENGHFVDTLKMPYPCVLGISNGMQGVDHPVLPKLSDIRKSYQSKTTTISIADLHLRKDEAGTSGSLTDVKQVTRVDWQRTGKKEFDLEKAVEFTLQMIHALEIEVRQIEYE